MTTTPHNAARVHLHTFDNILHPRGPMGKESLGRMIADRMLAAYEEWCDEDYADSRSPVVVRDKIIENARLELERAFDQFDDDRAAME